MKILYLSNHDLDSHSGVVKKIKGQVSQWSKMGHEVYIFTTFGFKVFNSKFEVIDQYRIGWKIFRRTSHVKTIVIHFFSLLAAFKLMPQIVYSRYFLYSPFLSIVYFLYPVVMEINSDDVSELKDSHPYSHFYNILTRKLMFMAAAGHVFVSQELKEKNQFFVPNIVVANGINLESSFELGSTNNYSRKIQVGFSGTSNQNWHGLDKIISLFERNKELMLHVVGSEGASRDNIKFYGKVTLEENLKILSACSVCISTLALHRNNMLEASPLKSREYVILGKRIIYAYDDTDLDKYALEFPGLFLKISNNENNVQDNETKILNFLRSPTTEEEELKIKEIGRKVLSYERKELTRISFFEKILNGKI